MEPKKYDYIDLFRGIAILLVLLVHCGQYGQQLEYFPGKLKQFVYNGCCGVQIFFLVSAYTLMLSQQSRKNESNQTTRFYIRRFFRIAPIYYAGIVYYTLQTQVGFKFLFDIHAWSNINVTGLITNLFFIHGFHPATINNYVPGGWSIAVEMTFYLVFPLIVKHIKTINHAALFLFLALLMQKILYLSLLGVPFFQKNYYLSLWFPNQLPIFAMGILTYFIINDWHNFKKYNLLFLSAICLIYVYFCPPVQIAYTLAFALLLLFFHFIPSNKIIYTGGKIGKISYSMYLVHFAVLYWMAKFKVIDYIIVSTPTSAIINFSIRYIILLFITIGVSHISYTCIEIPFQKKGKRLIDKYFK